MVKEKLKKDSFWFCLIKKSSISYEKELTIMLTVILIFYFTNFIETEIWFVSIELLYWELKGKKHSFLWNIDAIMNYVSSTEKNPFVVYAILLKKSVMRELGWYEHNNPTESSKPSHHFESNID